MQSRIKGPQSAFRNPKLQYPLRDSVVSNKILNLKRHCVKKLITIPHFISVLQRLILLDHNLIPSGFVRPTTIVVESMYFVVELLIQGGRLKQ
jgi:hypothetical protein